MSAANRSQTVHIRRILLVDDEPLVRRGLRQLLDGEPDLRVAGEATGVAEALDRATARSFDLAVMDISIGDGDGLELIKRLRARVPSLPVLVLSHQDEEVYAERVLRAGGRGYLPKQAPVETVLHAVRRVLEGHIHVSEDIADRLLETVAGWTGEEEPTPVDRLSDRELEVYRLLGSGLGTRRIAERLQLSVKTIETHREKIKLKLGFADSNQMVRHAVQWVLEQEEGGL
jgi:DNA-binding NarL/FixJ family response regulator